MLAGLPDHGPDIFPALITRPCTDPKAVIVTRHLGRPQGPQDLAHRPGDAPAASSGTPRTPPGRPSRWRADL
jgi:hypothetical protein